MLVWALPVLSMMTALSFLYEFLAPRNISSEILRYVGPMAIGFIIVAAVRIGRKAVKDISTVLLSVFGAPVIFFMRPRGSSRSCSLWAGSWESSCIENRTCGTALRYGRSGHTSLPLPCSR